MTRYRYDGTPEGFFCALAAILGRGDRQAELCGGGPVQIGLFGDELAVATCGDVAAQAAARLERLGGRELVHDVLLVLLSGTSEVEKTLLAYLWRVMDVGGSQRLSIAEPAALRFLGLQRAVLRELHRYQGVLRFESLTDGLLWASYRPKANLSPLLAPYFARRMPAERWLIGDVGRGIGIFHQHGTLTGATLSPEALRRIRQSGRLETGSDAVAELWRTFYRAVSIPERRNPHLQRSFLPQRLWPYLTEMAGSQPSIKAAPHPCDAGAVRVAGNRRWSSDAL